MLTIPALAEVRRFGRRIASIVAAALLAAPAAAQTPTPSSPASPAAQPTPSHTVSEITVEPSPSVSEITVEPRCLSFKEAQDFWEKHGGDGIPDAAALAIVPHEGRRTKPSPGTRESLIRFLDSLWAGKPNYEEMDPRLAQAVHEQWDGDKAKVLGRPMAVQFMGASRRDLDVYAVEYQCAKAIWALAPLDPSGKVYWRTHIVIAYGDVNLLTAQLTPRPRSAPTAH